MERELEPDELPFVKEPVKFAGVRLLVLLRIDRVFTKRLLRREIRQGTGKRGPRQQHSGGIGDGWHFKGNLRGPLCVERQGST